MADSEWSNMGLVKRRAAEILAADAEALGLFRYGASYVTCLLAAVDFYNGLGCDAEALDIIADLKQHNGAADTAEVIARNLLRLGVYWDEAALLEAACKAAPDTACGDLFELVRLELKEGK